MLGLCFATEPTKIRRYNKLKKEFNKKSNLPDFPIHGNISNSAFNQ